MGVISRFQPSIFWGCIYPSKGSTVMCDGELVACLYTYPNARYEGYTPNAMGKVWEGYVACLPNRCHTFEFYLAPVRSSCLQDTSTSLPQRF